MTAADRPSVTDNARAEARQRDLSTIGPLTGNGVRDAWRLGFVAGAEWAAVRAADYQAGRWCGECRYGVVEDPPCCTPPAAGRAETTTATDEDALRSLRAWVSDHASEAIDRQALKREIDQRITTLATARTRPTREQIAAVVHHVGWEVPEGYEDSLDPENCATCRDALNTADAVLALLNEEAGR